MVDASAKVVRLGADGATPAEMVKALRELHECLETNKPVPLEVSAIVAPPLGSALSALDSGFPASLDHHLGLKRHGGVSTSKALDNAKRDGLIRHLVSHSPQWQGKPISVISREMCTAFDRYDAGRWKRDRSSHSAPHDEPFSTFWKLKRDGLRMPGQNHLRKILTLLFQDPI